MKRNNQSYAVPIRPNRYRLPRIPPLCECGCGDRVECLGSRFLQGHNARVQTYRSPESNLKRSEALVGHPFWGNTEEMRKSIISLYKIDTTYRKRISETLKSFRTNNPGYYDYHDEIASLSSKMLWSDPNWRENQVRAIAVGNGNYVSRPQYRVADIIVSNGLPFRHNDGSYIVGGKVPDFWGTKDRLLIEVNGDYWHWEEETDSRVKLFLSLGYRTLILWESNLKTMTDDGVVNLITKWQANPELSGDSSLKCVETIHLAPV